MKASSLTLAILSHLWSRSSAWNSVPILTGQLSSAPARNRSLLSTAQKSSADINAGPSKGTPSSDVKYVDFGILISSFTDGIVDNYDSKSVVSASDGTRTAAQYFQYSLLSLLTMDKIQESKNEIEESVKCSPCQGPNIDSLDKLEKGDEIIAICRKKDGNKHVSREGKMKLMVDYLRENGNTGKPMEIRVVYIPTAMYALRADSQNTPGKQRQRARADGKKKRNQLVSFIEELFSNDDAATNGLGGLDINVSAVTLDLDDGSIKQPYNGSNDVESKFPAEGKEALTSWNPHLLYLEGGNTFWLHHCMNKGREDWSRLISEACCVTDSDERRPALYVGKSAGAIVAGKYVETATWKGWDDPSIVPGSETYNDWKGKPGLNFAGGISIFPHMSDDWVELVGEKKGTLARDGVKTLQEWEACCIEGSLNEIFVSG